MHVLILGSAGMLGRKFAQAIAGPEGLGGRPVARLTLADVIDTPAPAGFAGAVASHALDLADPAAAGLLAGLGADVIVHLAAVVSGQAEADFDLGYRVNLDATRQLFDALRLARAAGAPAPRVVFASSIAVFGAPFPPRIDDRYFCTPQTSYGTQKAIAELLLQDYSRRGFFDGVGLRLPTICVRPGAPNKAASGFFSNILREPLAGLEAVLPVSEDVRHWFASPRAAVGFLVRAATMDLAPLGHRRVLNMPGLSATVGEQIAALGRIAGPRAVALIRRAPDPTIAAIVAGWPEDFTAERAASLGFVAETSFDEILRIHIEDERGGAIG